MRMLMIVGGKDIVDYYMNRIDDFLNREVMMVS